MIRWRHPELGLVLAQQFIAAAEETGLIVPMGEWVLRTACAQNKAWQDAGLPPLAVSVNLSKRQLREDGLVEMIAKTLDETGLEARYLELELTETTVMGETQSVVERLRALKSLGILLSIDDFGTGYSKLADLKMLPLDQLKIDRSFVEHLPESNDAASITRAIVGMGHSLGLKVVAEGVETPAQAQFLASIWCGRAQGFHYSKPLPAAEFALWLASAQSMRTSTPADDAKGRNVAA